MLVFLDESGFVSIQLLFYNFLYSSIIFHKSQFFRQPFTFLGQKTSRIYGYSLVGNRATVKRQAQNWGPRITAIPVICTEGMIEVGIYQGKVDGAKFEEFVDQKLCPNLLPFNGINPRSVVIMGKHKISCNTTMWRWL